MAQFRKKPVVIEATCWDGQDLARVKAVLGEEFPGKFIAEDGETKLDLIIPTLEGPMRVSLGDWIIKGVKGEFYPCKPDIFVATYEPVS